MKVKLKYEPIKRNYGASLLSLRGVEDVGAFLNPTESQLQSFQDLDNIEEGVHLITQLAPDAQIALIVDSDVDGYTSAAIIYQYLTRLNPYKIDVYLHEGKAHGLEEHYEQIADGNYDLVIIPDAGSNDAEYAEKIHCPILILDHHLIDCTPTGNMTVINNQASQKYRNKELTGAGVVYQFCRALDERFGNDWANDYIDLAATGVCGDMGSGLETENQYLWKEGFKSFRNYFLLCFARKQAYSITGKMNATDQDIFDALNPISVAFYIVPSINAMIRIGTMEEKERMWLAFVDGHRKVPSGKRGCKGQMEEVAVESVRECSNARTHQNKFKDEAVGRIESRIFKYDLLSNKVLFIRLEEEDTFPSEINGLIAMALSQKYKRPTIVARLNDEGMVRGSARGLNNSELSSFKQYLDSTNLFEYAQGHDNAFGCSIANKDLQTFHEKANEELKDIDFGDTYYEVEFERQALADDVQDLIIDLSKYKDIWSTGCGEPLIYIRDLHFKKEDVQIMGKNKDTVKIVKNGIAYMKFFAKELISKLDSIEGDFIKMEVVGKANLNCWNGVYTPQIFIENYEIKADKLTDF